MAIAAPTRGFPHWINITPVVYRHCGHSPVGAWQNPMTAFGALCAYDRVSTSRRGALISVASENLRQARALDLWGLSPEEGPGERG